jgi:multiple sugar transport system substrate-binding protein
MATQRAFSRRRFLGALVGTATASVLAACGGGAGAPAKPTEAPKPAGAPAAAPAASPAAAPAAAGGEVVVWQTVDYIPAVTQLINERYTSVGQQKGFKVTFEELPNTAAGADRFNAAVQAGTPPDIWRVFDYQTQYWRIQGQTADVTDLVKPYTTQAGGYWQPVELTCKFQDKWYGMPQAVNCWPMHVRQDILDKAGLKYPKDWDEFRTQGKQLTKPPLYYYGMTLGRINDTNNHFTGMLWTFGGKLQNEDGSLAVKAGDEAWIKTIELVAAMFNDDKIIPPGSVNWDDSANNQGFQSEQLVITSNPTSIYNWLLQNKPELTKATKFYSYPAGPAGSFGQVDVWAQALFKNGKGGENARTLISAFGDPTWYADYINKKLQGRFVPVYKDMIKDDLWQKNDLYTEYQKIIETGRIMSYASAPLGAISELTTKYLIGDLMQDVLVKKVKPADALASFVKSAEEIYNKPENKR